ncbi:MAG: ArsR/SmtB family transcription factor [Candidatus Hodarchaeales archaeon]|jgi:DNA-binding transcriptional ArsR family regulator
MESSEIDHDINEVLKALNHEIRRKIIRFLHNSRNPIAYSDFLELLDLPASSNVAYHIMLLTKPNILIKTPEGKYTLSELGERVALLLDIAGEPQSSPFTSLYLGFSHLSPLEILLGAWWLFFLLLGAVFWGYNIILGLIFLSFAILSVGILFYKIRTIWVVLLINNFLWILFAPENRIILLTITLTNLISAFILFPKLPAISPVSFPLLLLGGILFLSSLTLSIYYILSFRAQSIENNLG